MKEDINSVTKGSEWQLHVHGTLFHNELVSDVTIVLIIIINDKSAIFCKS